MLTLSREKGQSVYLGRALSLSNLERTCDYRITVDAVDHRVATRRVDVTIASADEVLQFTLTPDYPDLDFAPDIRLAFLSTHEFVKDGQPDYFARIGIKAPREMKIVRDNACPVMAVNVTGVSR